MRHCEIYQAILAYLTVVATPKKFGSQDTFQRLSTIYSFDGTIYEGPPENSNTWEWKFGTETIENQSSATTRPVVELLLTGDHYRLVKNGESCATPGGGDCLYLAVAYGLNLWNCAAALESKEATAGSANAHAHHDAAVAQWCQSLELAGIEGVRSADGKACCQNAENSTALALRRLILKTTLAAFETPNDSDPNRKLKLAEGLLNIADKESLIVLEDSSFLTSLDAEGGPQTTPLLSQLEAFVPKVLMGFAEAREQDRWFYHFFVPFLMKLEEGTEEQKNLLYKVLDPRRGCPLRNPGTH